MPIVHKIITYVPDHHTTALHVLAMNQGLVMTRAVHVQAAPVSVEAKRHIYAVGQAVPQRFQRRHPSGCHELMYMFDGDDNGVCRFIGTSYGQQEWVNPVLCGQMKVNKVDR